MVANRKSCPLIGGGRGWTITGITVQ